ncbi:MAG: site-specific DNA-methyltransferase [Planctomycetaceae bacterium]|nr:site-specific DNA-methyltransferase [Planctomycetaceae bacterium]
MGTNQVNIGNATLYCGDCFSVLPKLDVEFDAVISDPPFGITDCEWDCSIPLDSFWAMVECQTKQSANFVLFGCGKFTVDLVNSKRKWYRYDLVWAKSKKCGFLNANLMPMRGHESILVFIRPGFFKAATYNPQKTPGGKAGIKIRNHRSSVYRDKGEYTHVSDGTMHPSSVLPFNSEFGQHPTQKPLALMEFLVRSYTNEKDIVIDPFMGSGTTGIACVKAGRTFIGIERNKKYFDIACERISNFVRSNQ